MKELYPYYIKYKNILIPSGLFLLGLFLLFAVIMPQLSAIGESNSQISAANEKINTLQNSISVVESANTAQTQENLQTVTKALPTAKDIALIFEALSDTANKAGVSLDDFSLKVGGLYGKAEQVETGGVTGVPGIDVEIRVTGDAKSFVAFAQSLQQALPLSEIKLVEMNDGEANYDVSFFYKPIDLSVVKQDNVPPLSQSDVNLINQLNTWEQ